MPDTILKDPTIFGRMVFMSPPTWFSEAPSLAKDMTVYVPQTMEEEGDYTGTSGVGAKEPEPGQDSEEFMAYWEETQGALQAIAKFYFQQMYKRTHETQLRTRLMITTDLSQAPDKVVIPGTVCRVMTAKQNLFFDFYITHVIHTINVQAGTAGTEITGAYVRGEGQYEGIAVTGDRNALYDPGGGSVAAAEAAAGEPDTIDVTDLDLVPGPDVGANASLDNAPDVGDTEITPAGTEFTDLESGISTNAQGQVV